VQTESGQSAIEPEQVRMAPEPRRDASALRKCALNNPKSNLNTRKRNRDSAATHLTTSRCSLDSCYSYRNASVGLTCDARRAGI